METIIKVQFFSPVEGRLEWFFTSVAAIFDQFTPEQIGCSLATLWGADALPVGKVKATGNCLISRHYIARKPQTNKRPKQ